MKALPHGVTPRLKPLPPRRQIDISVLDVGTTKVVCLIGRLRPVDDAPHLPGRTHKIEMLGIGHQRSRGVKAGAIVDMEAAERSIRLAVDAAERMAEAQVSSVIVSLSAGRLASEHFHATVPVAGRPCSEDDIQRVLRAGSAHSGKPGRTVLHSLPVGYAVEGTRGVRDPRGMVGTELGVDMHMVTADSAPIHNLTLAVERCHLAVDAVVASPYAAGLAALADDEAEIGATVVDIGGGTTTVSVFSGGRCVHVDAIALGGHHVTMDIARGLSTPLDHAERLKTLHATVLPGIGDQYAMIDVIPVGDDGTEAAHHVPLAHLMRIVVPRVEEILELVRDRLDAHGQGGDALRRVVLTGGGVQLTGLTELASRILGRKVRAGRPLGLRGLPEAAKGPAFATVAGLLIYPQVAAQEHFEPARTRLGVGGAGGYFARVSGWLRDGF
ncbi:MAG TPA: cell division protein FtsA [Hyphomicrobiales bacterium]|nr:cell division protein FtsA [Hyphomicrobiales bacterium]